MPRLRRLILPLLLVLLLIAPAAAVVAEPGAPPLTRSFLEWIGDWLTNAADTLHKTDRQAFGPDADPNGISLIPPDESQAAAEPPSGTGEMGPDSDPNG